MTLELVFVFTLRQLTAVLADSLDERGLLQVAVMLGVSRWMYGGSVWLTNALAPSASGRLPAGRDGYLSSPYDGAPPLSIAIVLPSGSLNHVLQLATVAVAVPACSEA